MSKLIETKNDNQHFNINKMSMISVKYISTEPEEKLNKPDWLKIKLPIDSSRIQEIKSAIRKNNLHTVCEEASCPNITTCFNLGTSTFMILGSICTRRCPFCDVKHGRPNVPDVNEPERLAQMISDMNLNYAVITSVNRDDLHDGGAKHFIECIIAIRNKNPMIRIEILVPDFRNCMLKALRIINNSPPDVFNHNLESVPRLYRIIRPGANYNSSLKLLKKFKKDNPHIITKSGLMVGLGETNKEIIDVMYDLRHSDVTMLTVGQYLPPSRHHLKVKRYVSPKEFDDIRAQALYMGFTHASCGPLVRSSYHADMQINGIEVK